MSPLEPATLLQQTPNTALQLAHKTKTFMNITEVLSEEMNKSLKEANENKQWKEILNKTVQDLQVEIESIKKTQTEGNLEIKHLGAEQKP